LDGSREKTFNVWIRDSGNARALRRPSSYGPPDGNDGLLPTFDAEDQCGSYEKCSPLALANQIEASKTCIQKLDECIVALDKSNAEAEAHNSALDACRAHQPAPNTPGR
jgi:hypothetical protein